MTRIICIIIIKCFLLSELLSQVPDYNLRRVSIVMGDTIVKAQVINQYSRKSILPGSPYYWYGSGKINVNVGSFSGKVLHGKYEMFDKNNRLIGQGNFDYGLKQGNWIVWFANGLKKEESFYKDGLLVGERLVYRDGKIFSKEKYNNGLLHGKSIYYQKDSAIIKEFKEGIELVKKKDPEKQRILKKHQKRQPVFNRTYKPKAMNDTTSFEKPEKRGCRFFKNKINELGDKLVKKDNNSIK